MDEAPYDGLGVADMLERLCSEVPVAERKEVYDADIVTTLLAHGERRLMTFNSGDFRGYGARIELIDGKGRNWHFLRHRCGT